MDFMTIALYVSIAALAFQCYVSDKKSVALEARVQRLEKLWDAIGLPEDSPAGR